MMTTSATNGTTRCGGFVGWADNGSSGVMIKNSLYAPATIPEDKYRIGTDGSCTFARNGADTGTDTEKSYYTETFGDPQGTFTSATSDDLKNLLGSGWEVKNGNVVPVKDIVTPTIVNPTFVGVTISNEDPDDQKVVSTDGAVRFKGTYAPISYTDTDTSILFLGAENTLYYPESGASIGAFRAYFQLNGISATDLPAGNVKMFFGDERPTDGVGEVQGSQFKVQGEDTWYDLDGRRLSGKPTQKGIYVNNGRKVVMK